MKKTFFILSSFLVIVLLAGCAANNLKSKTPPRIPVAQSPVQLTPDVQSRPVFTDMADGEKISTYVATGNDLEKFIVEQKNNLFQSYDENSKAFADGYPVVFSSTTDPAVRFAEMVESGGDAATTTQYFINQSKHSVLEVNSSVSGGDFGQSGSLYLFLNGGSKVNFRVKETVVDEKKSEVSYQGLLVNDELQYSLKNPLILKLESPRQFKILGVSPDLTQVYFFDGTTNKFSYDMTSKKLQLIQVLPAGIVQIVKP